MSTHYKIHPAIGIARVGTSTDGYFLAPEDPAGEPFELNTQGETQFRGYKDASHLMRRQGVRFRVFEYQRNEATGVSTLVGEVTPDHATINWSVRLGNRKASAPLMASRTGPQQERVIAPTNQNRNATITNRDQLVATGSATNISGVNQALTRIEGTVMTKSLFLGEAGTDSRGRLIILGGTGDADSWLTPPPAIGDYLNNNGWYDGTSDGPIDATLVFPDRTERIVDEGAWVIAGPPDFAPQIVPVVTLYDVMVDTLIRASRYPHYSEVSFAHDVLPILKNAASLRFVNRMATWTELADAIVDENMLADPAAPQQSRQDVYDLLLHAEEDLADFRLTRTQKEEILEPWVAGHFNSDLGSQPPPLTEPEKLDRSGLVRSIGSGFFPGIEMGFLSMNPDIYTELGRLTRATFADFDGDRQLKPGSVTDRMALPWQADFIECSRTWWPAQRPDTALFKQDGSATTAGFRWDRGLVVGTESNPTSHLNMVRHFSQLGVIDYIVVNGQQVLAETGRDPSLPRT